MKIMITEASETEDTDILLGSDATETAVKLAKYYFYVGGEDRSWVISRRQSYHGNTMYALSLSGHEARREPFKGMINSNVSFVSPCNEYRDRGDHESVQDYVSSLKNELMEEFERIGPGKVAAFIAEPVVGAVSAGILPYPVEILLHIRPVGTSMQCTISDLISFAIVLFMLTISVGPRMRRRRTRVFQGDERGL
jgi:adenosylmethionine-8-amino-7-oxononanoate aminotransferase